MLKLLQGFLSKEKSACLSANAFRKVFGIKDPAGQPQYLVEFAKNRPSLVVK